MEPFNQSTRIVAIPYNDAESYKDQNRAISYYNQNRGMPIKPMTHYLNYENRVSVIDILKSGSYKPTQFMSRNINERFSSGDSILDENDLSVESIIDHSNNNPYSYDEHMAFEFNNLQTDEQIECFIITCVSCNRNTESSDGWCVIHNMVDNNKCLTPKEYHYQKRKNCQNITSDNNVHKKYHYQKTKDRRNITLDNNVTNPYAPDFNFPRYLLQINEYKGDVLVNTNFIDLCTDQHFDEISRVMICNDQTLAVIFFDKLSAYYEMTIVFVNVSTKETYLKDIEFIDPSFRYDYVFFVNEQVDSEKKTLEKLKEIYKTGSLDVLRLIAQYVGTRMEIISCSK